MARPISKVTADNFYTVKSYFQSLLEREGLFGKYSALQEQKAETEAKFAFRDLSQPIYSSQHPKIEEESKKIAIEALQAWIEQHAAHQWPKFLAVVRQRKFNKKKPHDGFRASHSSIYAIEMVCEKSRSGLE